MCNDATPRGDFTIGRVKKQRKLTKKKKKRATTYSCEGKKSLDDLKKLEA